MSTTISVSGCAARIRRVASTPSSLGIRRSISTTSGRCRAHSATASSPSAAAATGLMSARGLEQRHQALAHERLVVGDEHAHRTVHAALASLGATDGRGRRSSTRQPSGRAPALSVPPSSCARARACPCRPYRRRRLASALRTVARRSRPRSIVHDAAPPRRPVARRRGRSTGTLGAGSVLAHVGERLLDDAQHRLPGLPGQPRPVAVDRQLAPARRRSRGTRRRAPRSPPARRTASPRSAPTARRVSCSPSRASAWARCTRAEDGVAVGALLEQRARRLELDRQTGQRMGEHVVDLARDPRRLLQARRAQLLLVRALGLGQQQLGLLGPLRATGGCSTREQHGGKPERVGEQTDAAAVVDADRHARAASVPATATGDGARPSSARSPAATTATNTNTLAALSRRGADEDAAGHRQHVQLGGDRRRGRPAGSSTRATRRAATASSTADDQCRVRSYPGGGELFSTDKMMQRQPGQPDQRWRDGGRGGESSIVREGTDVGQRGSRRADGRTRPSGTRVVADPALQRD